MTIPLPDALRLLAAIDALVDITEPNATREVDVARWLLDARAEVLRRGIAEAEMAGKDEVA